MNANDPLNDPCSGQLDYELSLVAKFFENNRECCEGCINYRQLSEVCEAQEEGDATMCPQFMKLVDDAQNAIVDGGLPTDKGWTA